MSNSDNPAIKEFIERASLMGKLTSSETQKAMREMDGDQAYAFFLSLLNSEPASDVVEQKRGEWVARKEENVWRDLVSVYGCTNCGKFTSKGRGITVKHDICPNCGADMKEANDAKS